MITSAKGTRKGILIFMGMFLSLIWGGTAFSSDSLIVVPSSLNLTLASGQLASYRLEVINLENIPLEVKSVFDSQWMFIYPSEFKILPERARSVWAIFFIRREESPPKEGKVEFRAVNSGKPATVRVACSAPPRPTILPPVRREETKPNELEKLREEIKERDQKIAELKEEMEEAKAHLPAMENPPPQKEEGSPPEARSQAAAVPAPATETASRTFLVTKANVKMRSEPNSAGKVILVLKSGREVEKIGESGEYTKVRLSWGDSGWVVTRTLRMIKKPGPPETEPGG